MNDRRLIELVRKYPVLYDLSHPKYMDTEFKNAIWNQIGKAMEIEGPLCKTRWSNIRDNYRKSLKKYKIVTVLKGKTMKQYKYSQQLRFLIKYFEKKEAIPNIDDITNQDFTGDDDESESIPHKNEVYIHECKTEDDDPQAVELQSRTSSNLKQTDSSQCPIPRKKPKQSVPNAPLPQTADATVMKYPIKKDKSIAPFSSPSQHPVDAFLSGLAPVLKKLPLRYWHYAKADIFTAVQNYEFKLLMDQEQLVETSLIPTCPTPSYSGQPSPGVYPESMSTCSTPSFSEQPSPAESYHQST